MIGKQRRLQRIFDAQSGKAIVIPLDHGLTMGPIHGIENMELLIKMMENSPPSAVVLHKGAVARYGRLLPKETAILMHLSASIGFSPNSEEKVLVGSVEEAVRLGADGISIHVNFGGSSDHNMLLDAGKVAEACMQWGMPLLIMIYVKLSNAPTHSDYSNRIAHCIRICEELGADMVKVPVPTSATNSFNQAIVSSSIPVLAAGGEQYSNVADYITQVKNLMGGKTAGICAGRNIFQNKDPRGILLELQRIVHGSLIHSVVE